MKGAIPTLIFAIGISGCSQYPEPMISAPGTIMKYEWTIQIPVVRPSSWNSRKLLNGAEKLANDFRHGNILFVFDSRSGTPTPDPAPSRLNDGWWRTSITEGLWYDKGWDYEAGTTAQIYLRSGGGDAPPYHGRIVFMNAGRMLGMDATAGGSDLPDYYRAMKELGIYIP